MPLLPFITSVKLCGAMFVAIPTAIPEAPFTNKFGIRVAGKTVGSYKVSSKFNRMIYCLLVSISDNMSSDIFTHS